MLKDIELYRQGVQRELDRQFADCPENILPVFRRNREDYRSHEEVVNTIFDLMNQGLLRGDLLGAYEQMVAVKQAYAFNMDYWDGRLDGVTREVKPLTEEQERNLSVNCVLELHRIMSKA